MSAPFLAMIVPVSGSQGPVDPGYGVPVGPGGGGGGGTGIWGPPQMPPGIWPSPPQGGGGGGNYPSQGPGFPTHPIALPPPGEPGSPTHPIAPLPPGPGASEGTQFYVVVEAAPGEAVVVGPVTYKPPVKPPTHPTPKPTEGRRG